MREVKEECGIDIDRTKLRYVTTMNVRGVEFDYHNVGIFMVSITIPNTYIGYTSKEGWDTSSQYRTREEHWLVMEEMGRVCIDGKSI